MSDTPHSDAPQAAPGSDGGAPTRRKIPLKLLIHLGIAGAVLAGAWFMASYLMHTKPSTKRRPAVRQAQLVEVRAVTAGDHRVQIEASGTVMASRQITLLPRVQGEIRAISPALEPGGIVPEGEVLVTIDTTDYLLAEKQAKANLSSANANLKLEQGNQAVAKVERELVGLQLKGGDEALMLRKPQLEAARAQVAVARAALERTRVDLERTTLKAPFPAVVQSRAVNLGSRVTTGTELARLVGTDVWWIEIALPVDQLRWISLPEGDTPGATVILRHPSAWGPEASRTGRVVRLAAGLEELGRMARLLVEIKDPLALAPESAGKPKLHLGAWVQAEIEGQTVNDAIALPRRLLRDDLRVHVMTPEDTLEIREPTVAWRGREEVLITAGLRPGDRVVESELPAAVEGMALALVGSKPVAPAGTPEDKPRAGKGEGGGKGKAAKAAKAASGASGAQARGGER